MTEKYYVIICHGIGGYIFLEFDIEEEAIKSIAPFGVDNVTIIKGTKMKLSLKVGESKEGQ